MASYRGATFMDPSGRGTAQGWDYQKVSGATCRAGVAASGAARRLLLRFSKQPAPY